MRLVFGLLLLSLLGTLTVNAQTTDTISNWDGIAADWQIWPGTIEIVDNPHQEGLNLSAHCIKVTSTSEPYDLFLYNLPYVVSFDEYPKYSMLCFPPAEGGDVVLKFENSDVSSSQEIRVTTTPGQWNRLDFDFTGYPYSNYTRMVIFFDFLGTLIDQNWYFDDITRQSVTPYQLESNLPIIVINTDGVEIPDDPKITAHIGIVDNGPGNLNHLNDPYNDYYGLIGIEIRGQSTQMFPKKCFGFETRNDLGENVDTSLLGLPGENDWILNAPYSDKSLMRNTFSFEIGHRTGQYCTRNVYCELVINNDYQGIYILQEKIKKDKNRVDIATLNPEENMGDNITGGYIISVDKIPWGFQYGADGWLSSPEPSYPNAMDITFQYYYPDAAEMIDAQKLYIKNYFTQAETALIGSKFKDPAQGYLKYFDAPSFIDFMLVCEISKEVDKYRYSTYFYKDKDSNGGKICAGPLWDFDLGYGNVDYWPSGLDITGWLYKDVQQDIYSRMYWWKRMMEDPYFRDLAKTRWVQLRSDKLSYGSINKVIDSMRILTNDARIRNFDRWPILGEYVWPNHDWYNNDYDDELANFKDFVFDRIGWMDTHFDGNVLNPYAGISAQSNRILVTLSGDYFRNPILKTDDFKLNDAPATMTVDEVEYISPSQCALTLSSDVSAYLDVSVTVDKRALNTWNNLKSNKLATAGIPEIAAMPDVIVFIADGMIHLRCFEPDRLPENAEIYAVSGQIVAQYKIQKSTENAFPEPSSSGIYFLKLIGKEGQKVIKIVVAGQ